MAHAARAGFVAITLLRSLVKSGDLSNERLLEFQKSIPTVASDFQFSLSNNLDIELLIKKFGHLRPGTYDVNQLAYWENPEFYFNKNKEDNQNTKINSYKFEFNQKEIKGLKNIIDELQTEVTVTDLIKYFEEAIKSRESTKFNFTKNLSLALDLIIDLGDKDLGLTREKTGYLKIEDFKDLRLNKVNKKKLHSVVKLRKLESSEKQLAKLPSLILNEKDFLGFEQDKSEANFITISNVIADLLFIESNHVSNLNKKIVAIPNADPGFDWIFFT